MTKYFKLKAEPSNYFVAFEESNFVHFVENPNSAKHHIWPNEFSYTLSSEKILLHIAARMTTNWNGICKSKTEKEG
jgi:hypothetical protein